MVGQGSKMCEPSSTHKRVFQNICVTLYWGFMTAFCVAAVTFTDATIVNILF